MYVEYSSTNSGGSWWLKDEDWKALEAAGWKVEWADLGQVYEDHKRVLDADGTPKLAPNPKGLMRATSEDGTVRFLGALAYKAFRAGLPLHEAVAEWERVTGACSTDAGCPCCGQPHTFTEYDDEGKYVTCGPDTVYEARW